MNTPAPTLTATAQAVQTLGQLPGQQYICNACGYIYDEAEGDADSGLAPGTRFADIPDDWACPLCGVTKADFVAYIPAKSLPQATTTALLPATGSRNRAGVVIVGGGRAGWQVAEQLRATDATLPITLVTACAGDLYDKPLLSVAMARGLDTASLVKEKGADAAHRLQVRLLPQTHAVRICRETRQLRTTRGNLRYAHLVLAHGAQPTQPPTLPANLCWRINHLGAYLQLRAALGDSPKDVVMVGAGLVGCELANDLALGGHRVTLLETQATPLARWEQTLAGVRLLEAWKDLPIRYVGEVVIDSVEKLQGSYRVTTACGQRFAADHVIAATGLQTPSRLAQGAGLTWNQGIAVDAASLRTNDARIHALGDCITVNGQASRFIEPIARQARTIAAAVCSGTPVPYEAKAATVRVKTTSLPMTLN